MRGEQGKAHRSAPRGRRERAVAAAAAEKKKIRLVAAPRLAAARLGDSTAGPRAQSGFIVRSGVQTEDCGACGRAANDNGWERQAADDGVGGQAW